MRKFLLILAAAATAITATVPVASADPYWGGRPHYRDRGYYDGPVIVERRRDRGIGGDALAAGAIGLAAGALLGSALAQPRPAPAPVYQAPQPRYVEPGYGVYPPSYEDTVPARRAYRPAPRAARYYEDDQVARCTARYRSYDERSNTFLAYDGTRRICRL